MPYDPIRDCEVPSPATSTGPGGPWREGRTPGSEGTSFGHPYPQHPSSSHHPSHAHSHPPAFHHGQRSPGPSHSNAGGIYRSLLNEDESRRSSEQRSSVSSTVDDHYAPGGSTGGPRPSINHIINMTPGAHPISKSNSASSAALSSSPSNASPGTRHQHLDPNGYLTPAAPANTGMRHSRSPHPMSMDHMSPSTGYTNLPQEYALHQSGPPSRRTSGVSQRPMLPPQDIPSHYDYRTTPTHGHNLPLRSPSVSVSPRAYHAASLPPVFPSSRPGSSSASQGISNPASFVSPSHNDSRLSEDVSRPSSVEGAPRRSTLPARRLSQVPIYSPAYAVRSPSPVKAATPYDPKRLSRPTSLYYPITQHELTELKAMGQANNPLRKRKRKPMPSWSGPSTSSSRLPNDTDTSYFPPQDDRQDSRASTARASATPGPGRDRASGTPADIRVASHGRGSASMAQESNHLKRRLDRDEDAGHDMIRRKVSGNDAYNGIPGQVASHYNARAEVGVAQREFSPIIGLKKFNNWIKSVLIGKFALRARGGPGAQVLDIGCGKGGDLNKWKQARISLYVGLDIAATSVEQAQERYQKMHRPPFVAHFFAHDCFSRSINEVLPPELAQRDLYDNVTMQFCMHYAFETASKARMMIENVSRYLRRGGKFIGTIPDSQLLLARLAEIPEDEPTLRFGNSCYFVQFAERYHKGVFGHQYSFYLEDAIDDVPEYLVDWDNFVALAAEYGLHVIYKKAFREVLDEEQSSRDFGPLLGKMGVVNDRGESAMDEAQWEAANLYMAFAFEKV